MGPKIEVLLCGSALLSVVFWGCALPSPRTPVPEGADTFDATTDLISLHYDHAPDRDDGHSAAADRTLLEVLDALPSENPVDPVIVELFPTVGQADSGTCRRELLDHVIVLGERHLRRLLAEYVAYYNAERAHTVLGDSPEGRPSESRPSPTAEVVALPRVGGLHHRYAWCEAA